MAKKQKATPKQRALATRYAAIFGFPINDKDALVIGKRFEQLHKKHKGLSAKLVLEDARRPRSPLHKYFEWDDTQAAEKWRLSQASKLLRAVRVIIEEPGEEPREMRAFVHVVNTESKSVYLPAIEAMDNDEYRKQVLDQLKKELAEIKQRYNSVLDVAELFDMIDVQLRRIAI